jgi:phosphoribosylglycinamide formyltransferase-1
MYGDRVFEAVLASGDTESGVSVHLVDSEYDAGPVIAECRVAVLPSDSLGTLRARTRDREREFVVETLAAIARGEIGWPRI